MQNLQPRQVLSDMGVTSSLRIDEYRELIALRFVLTLTLTDTILQGVMSIFVLNLAYH